MEASVLIWDSIAVVVHVDPGTHMRPFVMIEEVQMEVCSTSYAEDPEGVMAVGLPVPLDILTDLINIPVTNGITSEVNPVRTDM